MTQRKRRVGHDPHRKQFGYLLDRVPIGWSRQALHKREKSGRHGKRNDTELLEAVTMLAEDEPLPRRHFDHALSGVWSDHRDCHIKPDLILI